MTVKDVVALAAKELGTYEELESFLAGDTGEATEGGTGDAKAQVNLLVDCFNLVENELALDYLPLFAEDEIKSNTGTIEFSALKRAAVRIVRVTDQWGNGVKFRLFPSYLKTQPGTVSVRYTYTPEKKSLEDESDYRLHVSERMFAYGIAAEYSLAMGRFEEAAIWDKKYKDSIEAAYRAQPCERIRSRRWV
ncbi:MAG: hypothetical protein IJX87_06685 [Clostridia bacterium]|nr:hypothetical protein [Clostridia bacterium]